MGRAKRNRTRNAPSRQNILLTKGYIETYLKEEISTLLTADQSFYQNLQEEPYVSHEEAEKHLSSYLKTDLTSDKCMVFSGLTGSGKSTIVRHVFGIKGNRIQIIDNNKLIIPIDFNRKHLSAEIAFTSNLQAAVDYLVHEYDIDFPDINNPIFVVMYEKKNEMNLDI